LRLLGVHSVVRGRRRALTSTIRTLPDSPEKRKSRTQIQRRNRNAGAICARWKRSALLPFVVLLQFLRRRSSLLLA
jgi:hypothetical protein